MAASAGLVDERGHKHNNGIPLPAPKERQNEQSRPIDFGRMGDRYIPVTALLRTKELRPLSWRAVINVPWSKMDQYIFGANSIIYALPLLSCRY
jgi:hypothetical protein